MFFFAAEDALPGFWQCCRLKPTRVIVGDSGLPFYACPSCASQAHGWERRVSLLKANRRGDAWAKVALLQRVWDADRAYVWAQSHGERMLALYEARVAVAWARPFMPDDMAEYLPIFFDVDESPELWADRGWPEPVATADSAYLAAA